jgi:hypothetical protein
MKRSAWVSAAGLIAVFTLAGCDHIHDQLLSPQNPGLINPGDVEASKLNGALALRIGANGRYRQVLQGEASWQMAGTLTDEFKNADFLTPRIDVDQRTMDDQSNWNYTGLTQSRGFVREALRAMWKYAKDSSAMIGDLYTELGFFEMSLSDMYCNGIPLGHTDTATNAPVYGEPLTTQQVYDSAITHFDSALTIITGTDVNSVSARRAAQVFKARALVMKGQFAQAAALVSAANVPTSYIYDMTFSSASGNNGMWTLANSTARISVADSFDLVNGVKNVITNALPFASAGDPRLPIQVGGLNAEDGVTPMFLSLLWKNRTDPMVLASGVDARLIEAEAFLHVNATPTATDINNMMAVLNALRTGPTRPVIGNTTVPAMPALATPATPAAAVALFFREKAFWTFGRGQRLPDMRRMLRLYSTYYPDENTVFPKGVFFKGGNYGADVNFPVPGVEKNNPLFHGCIDRQP